MARTNNLTDFLTDVSNSIKLKIGDNTPIPAANFDVVIANIETGIDTSDATATVEDLAEGVTAYVNGVKLTGMANTGTMNIADYIYITDYDINIISVSGKTSSSDVSHLIYPNSSQIIMQVPKNDMATYANLTPEILKQGETVLGVVGTFEGGTTVNNQDKTITQNGTYTADQGYTGIGTATVNVPIANTSEYNSDLSLSQQILGSNALPYIPLEYIESSGTQYIDTDFITNVAKQLTFETSIRWSNDITTRQNMGGDYGQFFGIRNGIYQIGVTDTNIVPSTNKFDEIIAEFNIPNNNGFIDVNDVMYYFTRSTWQAIQLYLFALNLDYQDDSSYNTICKMRYFKIYENHILVRDFIPVKRKSDNEICMYDKITNQFFTNQGTGTFIAGPVIN